MVPVNRMVKIEESAFDDPRMLELMADDEIRSLFLDSQGVTLVASRSLQEMDKQEPMSFGAVNSSAYLRQLQVVHISTASKFQSSSIKIPHDGTRADLH